MKPSPHSAPRNFVAVVLLTLLLCWILLRSNFHTSGLTAEQAFNATYPTRWLPSGSFTLRDGAYQGDPQAEGLEAMIEVDLLYFSLGNIDGKAGGDAAAILNLTFGTRKSFYELHVLVEEDGKAVHAGSFFLGDRIEIDCMVPHPARPVASVVHPRSTTRPRRTPRDRRGRELRNP